MGSEGGSASTCRFVFHPGGSTQLPIIRRWILPTTRAEIFPTGNQRSLESSALGLFGAAPECVAASAAGDRVGDTVGDLGASAALGLGFRVQEIRCPGNRAGLSPLEFDTDLAFESRR
jgi:hypothetical protein